MGGPLLLLLAVMAEPALTAAQTAYTRCLQDEADAAMRQRIPAATFVEAAHLLCDKETRAYREAAVASETQDDARSSASARFAAMDEANRSRLVETYSSRLRSRRAAMRGIPAPTVASPAPAPAARPE